MEIKRVAISEVVPWEKNPRGIKKKDYERLKKQIETLGVYKPLVVTRENGKYVVLGGNMRIRALKELGFKEVDVSIVDAPTDKEKIEYSLSDNDRAGYYEEEKFFELIQPLTKEIDFSMLSVDFNEPLTVEKQIKDFWGDNIIFTPESRWDKKKYAEMVRRIIAQMEFPYRTISDFELINDFYKLCNTDSKYSNAGLKLCYEFHPSIWRTKAGKSPTCVELWEKKREAWIERIILNPVTFRVVSLYQLRNLLGVVNAQHPWVFKPALARFYYRRYARPDELIVEPSVGWGSGMVAHLSLGRKSKFIGVDPSPSSNSENRRILEFLNIERDAVELIELPFEDWNAENYYGKVGFIITSPPYFDIEEYEGENQSFRRYPTLELWMNWLREYIKKCYKLLKNERYFVLDIGPVGKKRIDISNEVKQFLNEAGFVIEKIEIELVSKTISSDIDKHSRGEPFYIAKKVGRKRNG